MSKTDKKLAIADIPEVQAFIAAKERLDKFKQDNAQFFKWLEDLAGDYNDKLSEAVKVVRAKDVSCGPFDRFQEATTYDADAMYDLLGREKFLEYGGSEETVKKRGVDKKRVDMNIDNGNIDADMAKLIRKTSGKYRSVPELVVP